MSRNNAQPGGWIRENPRLFILKVQLTGGPITQEFAARNPVVSRTIQIRGDQTLKDLHRAIFQAFDRWEGHMYEFQVGAREPMDADARRYILPAAISGPFSGDEAEGVVDNTFIGKLGLEERESFWYWFDFGDNWWHQVDVLAIREEAPSGEYPKVTDWVGDSPPQYPSGEQ